MSHPNGMWRPTLACVISAMAPVASANCSAVLAALEKADREPRVAQYDIDSRDQPLTGKPVLVRIGKVVYDGFGGDYERHDTDGINPVLSLLRRADQSGKARCEALGSDSWRGTPATKLRFDNPLAPKSVNPTTIWVGRTSGLPLYHEIGNLGPGGFAWVYGDAVKEPASQKVGKP